MKRQDRSDYEKIRGKRRKEKLAILEQLEKTPLITAACAKAGVARATLYRWMKEDRAFSLAIEIARHRGRALVSDMAESALMKKIQESDMGAVKYWLGNNEDRYMTKRRPRPKHKPPNDEPPTEMPYIILLDQ